MRRIGAALAIASLAALTLAAVVLAATPTPDTAAGDPRSKGEGPGLVGDPLFAIVGVLGVVVIAIVLSLAYVRLTGGARETADRPTTGRR
jgi:hypothetical protein